MSLFAISDLHLSFAADKPMDVFGGLWENYEERLLKNWNKIIKSEDVIILCGDNSWATYLSDAKADFEFINNLPGSKILSKGNHDYWWTTLKKMNDFCSVNKFDTISFLQNNHFMYNDIAICGTRGWALTPSNREDEKIYNRELERLTLSLEAARVSKPKEIVAALHFPPDEKFRRLLGKYNVKTCIYGHLHGSAQKNAITDIKNGIKYRLVACDYLQFNPLKLFLFMI